MSTPTINKLQWGQAGEYDAVDDRMVIAALAVGRTGLIRPVSLSAGAGLNVNIAGGWFGVADCNDGTACVIGSRSQLSILVAAGGGASRTDYLWADINPDAGTWSLTLLTAAQLPGRYGLLLGAIYVPAGANTSSQFTFTAAGVTYGSADLRTVIQQGDRAVTSGTNTTFLRLAAGKPGATEQYLLRGNVNGRFGARGDRLRLTWNFQPGINSINIMITQVIGDRSIPRVTGQTYGANVGPNVAFVSDPIATLERFYITFEGQFRTQPTNMPEFLNLQAAHYSGANWNIYTGSFMSLQRAVQGPTG